MSYTPVTDFVALWRKQTNGAARAEMPALDFILSTLHRAGLISVVFNNAQPTTDQDKTMWFCPATPTYSGEGQLFLWDSVSATYKTATPRLLRAYLDAVEG